MVSAAASRWRRRASPTSTRSRISWAPSPTSSSAPTPCTRRSPCSSTTATLSASRSSSSPTSTRPSRTPPPRCSPPTPTRARRRGSGPPSPTRSTRPASGSGSSRATRAPMRATRSCVVGNLDAELGDKEFFGSEVFGFVDIALVPFVPWLPSYERYGDFSVGETAPRLAAWARRCLERDSVAKSLHPPEKVDEFITLLKKVYGIE
ncbi:hypothetical protein BS78_10G174600 [Paspalum vaginatum]|nr:hypothetical protein BS78_10G174600 [Paspalum vaginatum]